MKSTNTESWRNRKADQIVSKDTESAIKNLPTNKSPGQTASLMNDIKTFKEELIPVLFNSS